ncbi:unnamed protein product [Mytilus edulis]|uniref:Uncharacterized protein n=1 Tax=Mytilus edulis TaxID=6550 RepID=A0A8S3USN3_MYTED|nr:unnamed protein product [Mytilus edulis]
MALARKFGSEFKSEMYRAQLQCRFRKRDESISELATSIMKLTRQAYPKANTGLLDTLSVDYFIDALDDPDVRIRLRQTQPENITHAETLAIRLETCKSADRARHRTVCITTEENSGKTDVKTELVPLFENFMKTVKDEISSIKVVNDSLSKSSDFSQKNNMGRKITSKRIKIKTIRDQNRTIDQEINSFKKMKMTGPKIGKMFPNQRAVTCRRETRKGRVQGSESMMIEPSEKFTESNHMLLARSLLKTDRKHIPLRVLNASDQPVVLAKGQSVAVGEIVAEVNSQLARWLEVLSEYDFDIEHRRGRSHLNADALSRRPCSDTNCGYCEKVEQKEQQFIKTEILGEEMGINVINVESEGSDESLTHNVEVRNDHQYILSLLHNGCIPLDTLRREQHEDPDLERLIQFKEAGNKPMWSNL